MAGEVQVGWNFQARQLVLEVVVGCEKQHHVERREVNPGWIPPNKLFDCLVEFQNIRYWVLLPPRYWSSD